MRKLRLFRWRWQWLREGGSAVLRSMAWASPSQGCTMKRACPPSDACSRRTWRWSAMPRVPMTPMQPVLLAVTAGLRPVPRPPGELRVAFAYLVDGGGGGGVAGHHQRLDVVPLEQVTGDGVGARLDKAHHPFTVGRIAAVGQVHEPFMRQLGAQRLQHAQAPTPLSKTPMGCCAAVMDWRPRRARRKWAGARTGPQAAATPMPFEFARGDAFCHSAGLR